MVNGTARVSAGAVIPDQLVNYVKAVSGLESKMAGSCIMHYGGGQGVLVAYPPNDPLDENAIGNALQEALALPGLEHITVMSAVPLADAPPYAQIHTDAYWLLQLPLQTPSGKLANMLRRASSCLHVETASGPDAWRDCHRSLADDFCRRKSLDESTAFIFTRLGDYLASAPEALLFSALNCNGRLDAFAIADFESLTTAFYMFACRRNDASPGSSDLLLQNIMEESGKRGHSQINLGLGIDAGVEFFKKKWNAQKWLPLLETSWEIRSKQPVRGLFGRLFGRKRR